MIILLNRIYVRHTLLICCALCIFDNVKAQIHFINPSFEGTKPAPFVIPEGWRTYSGGSLILPYPPYSYEGPFLKAYDSLYYMGMNSAYPKGSTGYYAIDSTPDGIYQNLPCVLKIGVHYKFSFYAYSFYYKGDPDTFGYLGGLQIWLSDDSLNKKQLIFRKWPLTDTVWTKYEADFTPVKDYRNVIIQGYMSDSGKENCAAFIDYLSPITFNNKNYITTYISDTLINTYKPIQLKCVAIEDSVTYTWVSEPQGFTSNEQTPVANPLQTTTYIVTAHFKCGLDVSDTVKVRVKIPQPPPVIIPYVQTIILNNENWHIQNENTPISVKLYTALGQLLYTDGNYQNNYNPTHEGLAPGVYFYVINYNGGNEVRGKVLVVR